MREPLGLDRGERAPQQVDEERGRVIGSAFDLCVALHGEDQHLGHPGVVGERTILGTGRGNGDHGDIAIPARQQVARAAPRSAIRHGERQHQCERPARLDLLVGEVDEVRSQSGMAVTGRIGEIAASLPQTRRHVSLIGLTRSEARERRHGDARSTALVIGRPRERRIHDGKVERRGRQ